MSPITQEHSPLRQTLSNRLWGINWQAELPISIGSITVRYIDSKHGLMMIKQHFKEIYHTDLGDSLFAERLDEATLLFRERYYDEVGDFFVFEDQSEFVGMMICTVQDWNSYYVRSCSMRPGYQNQNIYFTFHQKLIELLQRYGVKRLEGDVGATNLKHLHITNKLGYVVQHVALSERFGATVHLCRFLDDKIYEDFAKRFSATFHSDSLFKLTTEQRHEVSATPNQERSSQ